jgi:DNA replication protein DnaC
MTRRIRAVTFGPQDDIERWQKVLRDSRIPERYWDTSAASITDRALTTWLRAVAEDMPCWLLAGQGFYLHGPWESGKTSLAAIIAMAALSRCERVLWLGVRDVPSAIFAETPEWVEVNKQLRQCDLLVIDDLGAQTFNMRGPAGGACESVVRFIHDRRRSLIVTSNWSWRVFHEKYQTEAPALVNIVDRTTTPVEVVNPQWENARKKNGLGL